MNNRLDMFELETVIKQHVHKAMVPMLQFKHTASVSIEKTLLEQSRQAEQVDTLLDAVFYKKQRDGRRNVFNEVLSQIIQLKSDFIEHQAQTQLLIEGLDRKTESFKFNQDGLMDMLTKYQSLLDEQILQFSQFRSTESDHRQASQKAFTETIYKFQQSIRESDDKVKQNDQTMTDFELKFFDVFSQLNGLKVKTDYIQNQSEQALKSSELMQITKLGCKEFEARWAILQNQVNSVDSNFDHTKAELQTMEHFIDKYVPIRISKSIEEFLHNCLPENQLQKLETFYMAQTRTLNEYLVREEKNADLKQLCTDTLRDLDQAIAKYQLIAKKRGVTYDVKRHFGGDEDSQSAGTKGSIKIKKQSFKHTVEEVVEIEIESDQDNMKGPTFERPDSQASEQSPDQERELKRRNKELLLDWVIEADFTKEISLKELGDYPFYLEQDEIIQDFDQQALCKIIKILMYKIGLLYKRQDVHLSQINDQFHHVQHKFGVKIQEEVNCFNQLVLRMQDEIDQPVMGQCEYKEVVAKLLMVAACMAEYHLISHNQEQKLPHRQTTLEPYQFQEMKRLLNKKIQQSLQGCEVTPLKIFQDLLTFVQQSNLVIFDDLETELNLKSVQSLHNDSMRHSIKHKSSQSSSDYKNKFSNQNFNTKSPQILVRGDPKYITAKPSYGSIQTDYLPKSITSAKLPILKTNSCERPKKSN